jgi:hypothetical protein
MILERLTKTTAQMLNGGSTEHTTFMKKSEHEKFEREKGLVEHLLCRLALNAQSLTNPNACATETGIDVVAALRDGRNIGVQVTVVDPHRDSGKARAQERRVARGDRSAAYGGRAQNDCLVLRNSLVAAVKRKIAIAERHDLQELGFAEVWLLVCSGIPEHGAVVSTMALTPSLAEDDLERAVSRDLRESKYDRCFFLPLLGVERTLYSWEKGTAWKKSVLLDPITEVPREAYTKSLILAALADDQQMLDRLCEEEANTVLREYRLSRARRDTRTMDESA